MRVTFFHQLILASVTGVLAIVSFILSRFLNSGQSKRFIFGFIGIILSVISVFLVINAVLYSFYVDQFFVFETVLSRDSIFSLSIGMCTWITTIIIAFLQYKRLKNEQTEKETTLFISSFPRSVLLQPNNKEGKATFSFNLVNKESLNNYIIESVSINNELISDESFQFTNYCILVSIKIKESIYKSFNVKRLNNESPDELSFHFKFKKKSDNKMISVDCTLVYLDSKNGVFLWLLKSIDV